MSRIELLSPPRPCGVVMSPDCTRLTYRHTATVSFSAIPSGELRESIESCQLFPKADMLGNPLAIERVSVSQDRTMAITGHVEFYGNTICSHQSGPVRSEIRDMFRRLSEAS